MPKVRNVAKTSELARAMNHVSFEVESEELLTLPGGFEPKILLVEPFLNLGRQTRGAGENRGQAPQQRIGVITVTQMCVTGDGPLSRIVPMGEPIQQ